MTVLIAGGGKGSWQIRGVQMGEAIGAVVASQPSASQWQRADVGVLVKHAALTFDAREARGARLVWDVLDCWSQPQDNGIDVREHTRRIHEVRDRLGIVTLIAATKQMAEDIGGIYLPHHSRPGLVPTPIRRDARVVAYEGQPKYLGPWRKAIEYACRQLGLVFAINPASLSDADVVVAFRGDQWGGDVCARWKSGVKYVNAIAAGRPVLTGHCAAVNEIKPFGQVVESPELVWPALKAMTRYETRQMAYEQSLKRAHEFALETIARTYREILASAVERKAA